MCLSAVLWLNIIYHNGVSDHRRTKFLITNDWKDDYAVFSIPLLFYWKKSDHNFLSYNSFFHLSSFIWSQVCPHFSDKSLSEESCHTMPISGDQYFWVHLTAHWMTVVVWLITVWPHLSYTTLLPLQLNLKITLPSFKRNICIAKSFVLNWLFVQSASFLNSL